MDVRSDFIVFSSLKNVECLQQTPVLLHAENHSGRYAIFRHHHRFFEGLQSKNYFRQIAFHFADRNKGGYAFHGYDPFVSKLKPAFLLHSPHSAVFDQIFRFGAANLLVVCTQQPDDSTSKMQSP
jgi:hypothetical protein